MCVCVCVCVQAGGCTSFLEKCVGRFGMISTLGERRMVRGDVSCIPDGHIITL